jgi:hypothetical protein
MPVLIHPATGEIGLVDDPTAYLEQGWQIATPEQADKAAGELDASTPGQQVEAQAERVVRGATLGQVRGFDPVDTREAQTRADVSQREHPVISGIADVVPQVAAAALTRGASLGLGAAEGGLGVLAAESAAGGLMGAGQAASERGQYLGDDPGQDAENVLLWGGLNFGLGAAARAIAGGAKGAAASAASSAAEDAAPTLESTAKAAEARAAASVPDAVEAEGIRPPTRAPVPLDDVELPGAEPDTAQRVPAEQIPPDVAAEIRQAADGALVGKDLRRLGANPLESTAKAEGMATDETFLSSGRLPLESDNTRGALPRVLIYPAEDGSERVGLDNGRSRFTAAQKAGLDEIHGQIVKLDADGNTLWDYVGPLRLKAEAPLVEGAASAVKRDAADEGFQRALANSSRSDANDIVQRALGDKPPEAEADSFGRQRRLYQNRGVILDKVVSEMQSDLTDVSERARALTSEGKARQIYRAVDEGNEASQRAMADGIGKNAAELAGTLRGEARAYAAASGQKGLQYPVPGSKGLVLALMDHAKAIGEAETGSARFEAIDGFKRSLDEFKTSLEAGSLNSDNPIHHQQLIPRVGELAGKLRAALEDSTVWGRAGDMQQAYNTVIHDRLLPSMKVFEDSVLKRTSKGYDALWNTEGWESKIRGLLTRNDLGAQRHVGTVLDAMGELGALQAKFGDAAGGAELAGKAAKIRRAMGLAGEVNDATTRMQAVGALAGAVPVVGGLLKEAVTGDMAQNFRALLGATDAAIDKGVDDWIAASRVRGQGGGGGALRSVTSAAARVLGAAPLDSPIAELARRHGVSHAMARFMGDDKSPVAAFQRARAALGSDSSFFEYLGNDYRSLAVQSPGTFMMLSGRASDLRQMLVDRMPANVAVSMLKPDGYPPSRESIEDWALYWNTVKDPIGVAKNLRSAQIQEIQTVQRGFPRFYERLQQRVLERVAAAQHSGTPLDDSFLWRLDLLFGGGVAATASTAFSRDAVNMAREYQLAQSSKRSAGASGSKGPTAANRLGPVQALAERGITFGSGG